MAAPKKTNTINLLPIDKFAKTTAGRILFWLLSTFRIIVIVIEMIVMLAFLSRFWLDAKNSDLSDEIKQKTARIQASKEVENQMRLLQKKLKVFTALAQSKPDYQNIVQTLSPLLPQEILLSSIVINANSVSITGIAPSELEIMQAMVNIDASDVFKEVSLQNVSVDQETNTLKFSININI